MRWWLGVSVGVLISLPLAWILSYAAALPYFLGVFFFMLFGLVIGAAMHRIAAPRRPHAHWAVLAGTTIVVMTCWTGSIFKESRDFPSDMAAHALDLLARRRIPDVQAFRAGVIEDVRRFLKERHPPGGTLGYIRWILAEGALERGAISGVDRALERKPKKAAWAVRVALSLGLLAFGVASQTLPLRFATERCVRAIDEKKNR